LLLPKALRLSNERKYETYIKNMASSQRQSSEGKIVEVDGIEEDMSFLEMLDVLNEGLINKGDLPVSLTTIVAKEFAVLARCTSTVRPTVQTDAYLLSVAHENVQGWRYHFY
jgi:hypothetical protein